VINHENAPFLTLPLTPSLKKGRGILNPPVIDVGKDQFNIGWFCWSVAADHIPPIHGRTKGPITINN
ncbi:hypothetical protein JW960_15950, partial [candidate division KSB1 bacterium]|nr:hypothetical protein [candidate division KSB1 bacterium]